MRILLLAPHPFYIDRGTPIDVDILLRALSERGEIVDVVAYRDGEERHYPGVTIHRSNTPRWLGRFGPGFSFKKLLADLALFRKAGELMDRHHYDVVHANEEAVFFAMWFQWRRGVPYVYDMDSSIAQQMVEKLRWLRPLARLFDWCEARAIRSALATAPVCNALADLAHRRGARHVTTLHDISQMSLEDFVGGESIRQRYGISGLIVMYVGNLEQYQGVDLLLEAFGQVLTKRNDIDLVIAGGTPAHIERYREKARGLGVGGRTHFLGAWPAARLGELLAEADILTAPRISGVNTPMKVFPYLHSGRAVLVTDIYSHTQILSNAICEFAPAEPAGFAAVIIRLANDPARRRQLGEHGRQFITDQHSYPAHRRRVDELYRFVERAVPLVAVRATAPEIA